MITFWAAFSSGLISGIAIGMVAGAIVTLALLWIGTAAMDRWGGESNAV